MKLPIPSLLLVPTALGAIPTPRGPTCTDIGIPVSIQADNLALPSTLTSANLETFINGLGGSIFDLVTNLINGTYNIGARYCEPEVIIASRANTIQLLVHGITYTRDYWSGINFDGDNYSWIAYASQQGYATLSIDRLGAGTSDHPGGIAVVQLPAQVEVTSALVQALRGGQIGSKSFREVIYVGHSYGSLIGNVHSSSYPADIDSYVFTGYTSKVKESLNSVVLAGLFLPSAVVLPARFGGLSVSYLSASNKNGATGLFFVARNADPDLIDKNWDTRGTVTIGEYISSYLSESVAGAYDGSVFVLTGAKDAIFCSADAVGLGTLTGHGDCGTGNNSLVAETKE
jgi:pimeloyl-ACP methyl ester carboxylesterase